MKAHIELLQEEFQRLLEQDKEEDLNRMYDLLHRIPDGLDPLRLRFEEFVKRVGLSGVERVITDDKEPVSYCALSLVISSTLKLTHGVIVRQDPKPYVEALLAVHNKNAETVQKAFRGDPTFVASLDKVCAVRSVPDSPNRRLNLEYCYAGLSRIHQPEQSYWHTISQITRIDREVCRRSPQEEQ